MSADLTTTQRRLDLLALASFIERVTETWKQQRNVCGLNPRTTREAVEYLDTAVRTLVEWWRLGGKEAIAAYSRECAAPVSAVIPTFECAACQLGEFWHHGVQIGGRRLCCRCAQPEIDKMAPPSPAAREFTRAALALFEADKQRQRDPQGEHIGLNRIQARDALLAAGDKLSDGDKDYLSP